MDWVIALDVATPYDHRINALNKELTKADLPYGEHGAKRRQNQLDQDANAHSMSEPAAASRAITKAGQAYRSESWDLVDAVASGTALEAIEATALPEKMRAMDAEARRQHVKSQAKWRAAIRKEIQALSADRRGYIARERATRQKTDTMGLDRALKAGLLEVAKKMRLRFAPQ